jgi:hypothetical protein
MTDLNDFRAALRAPDPQLRPLDVEAIMVAGTRVRRRRRLTVGAGSALAVMALLLGGSQVVRITQQPAVTTPGAAAETSQKPTATAPPDRAIEEPQRPPAKPPGTPGAGVSPPARNAVGEWWGNVVRTGIRGSDGEWVMFARQVEGKGAGQVTLGVTMGQRLESGEVVDVSGSNETEGSDRAPGFHAVSGPTNLDGEDVPAFGYYVGSPARITARVSGRSVTARSAVWSEDPSVVFFWFDMKTVGPRSDPDRLRAYDDTGKELPAGNNRFAYG